MFLAIGNGPIAFGSTVVAVVAPTSITIAADSKAVSIADGNIKDAGKICKIHQMGNVFFACTGLYQNGDNSYNIIEIARLARHLHEPIKDTVARFISLALPSLSRACEHLRVSSPSYFSNQILKSSSCVDVLFCGFENGHAVADAIYFGVSLDKTGHVKARVSSEQQYPQQFPPPANIMLARLGEHTDIERYLDTHPHAEWFKDGVIIGIKNLVQIEITAHPDKVGLPIDVLEIDPTEAHWIAKDGCCPDIQPY